ncbi:his Kinase A domain protein, partial [Vibrio cholerae HC-50A2]|jgi:hypothetical protein
MFIG